MLEKIKLALTHNSALKASRTDLKGSSPPYRTSQEVAGLLHVAQREGDGALSDIDAPRLSARVYQLRAKARQDAATAAHIQERVSWQFDVARQIPDVCPLGPTQHDESRRQVCV